jgi:hypothetical protein
MFYGISNNLCMNELMGQFVRCQVLTAARWPCAGILRCVVIHNNSVLHTNSYNVYNYKNTCFDP